MVPAHAGVVPLRRPVNVPTKSGPRARGGGPFSCAPRWWPSQWSPRTRGWSHGRARELADQHVVPAHAGVVPSSPSSSTRSPRGPRARGGGPRTCQVIYGLCVWSPRTRGWSRCRHPRQPHPDVVPAHAGVVPSATPHDAPSRGGPRARGGGPRPVFTITVQYRWSPRTRGWSLQGLRTRPGAKVVPAHAGVVPSSMALAVLPLRGPRARGGGPRGRRLRCRRAEWSPRTRGWSRLRECRRHGLGGGPRARGGGPWAYTGTNGDGMWSPRTRGWSPRVMWDGSAPEVVPAHAGVVPRPGHDQRG